MELDALQRQQLMDLAACKDCHSVQGWVNHQAHPLGFRWSVVVKHQDGCPVLIAHRRLHHPGE
jgi:hypothetical protein